MQCGKPQRAIRHKAAHTAYGTGTVLKQLGHHKVTTTEDFYSHLIEGNKEKVSACIADTLLRRKQA